jgi:hypothetical protein
MLCIHVSHVLRCLAQSSPCVCNYLWKQRLNRGRALCRQEVQLAPSSMTRQSQAIQRRASHECSTGMSDDTLTWEPSIRGRLIKGTELYSTCYCLW